MTLALIAFIVFLIIWGCQRSKIKGAESEEKRITKTNVELEREVAKRELDRLLARIDSIDPNTDLLDFLISLYEEEDIPMDYMWLAYVRGDNIEDKIKTKRLKAMRDRKDLQEAILWSYEAVSEGYEHWKTNGKVEREEPTSEYMPYYFRSAPAQKRTNWTKHIVEMNDEEIRSSVRAFIKLWEEVQIGRFYALGGSAVHRYSVDFEYTDPYFCELATDEQIFSLPKLPLHDTWFSDNDEVNSAILNGLREDNLSPMARILLNKTLSQCFIYLIRYGTLRREMHKLGYAVSRDGIHESEWQEQEKEIAKREADKEKHPWKYHENKYDNVDKKYWDRMK